MTTSTGLVEPAFFSAPPSSDTLGPEVAGVCEIADFTPDPEQRLALDAIFAIKPDNSPAAGDAGVIAPRQNIKTGLFKQCALGWLFVTDQRLIIWSAHEFSTAQEAHRDLAELIEGSDVLRKRVKTITRGNGDEGIELLTGQRVKFKARTKTGGRGLSGDKVVLDEAFALQATHMGSLIPTMSARRHGQVVYGSSAGLEGSAVLRGIRDRGRSGTDPGLVYLEWVDDLPGDCAMPKCSHEYGKVVGCRLDDVRRWERANTQLYRRIELSAIERERRAMPAAEFGRERLGWWDEDPSVAGVLPTDGWLASLDPLSQIVGPVTLALDVSPNRDAATIAVVGARQDGSLHGEITSNADGLMDSRAGVEWVAPRLIELCQKHSAAVVLDPASPAGSLLPDLVGLQVHSVTARQYAQACGDIYDAVVERRFHRLAQAELEAAVKGARKRDLAGGFAWDRKAATVNITPLVAVTLAHWGFRTFGGADITMSCW